MERVRPRPWQLFFAFWIPLGVFWWWLVFSNDTRDRRMLDEIAKAELVTARVVSGTPRRSRVTVSLAIPRTHGITSCDSILTRREFKDLWGGEVMVHVTPPPGPRCYTRTAYGNIEHGSISAPILGPIVFGAMCAWLFYWPLTRIDWNGAGTLKARWDKERAAARAEPAPR